MGIATFQTSPSVPYRTTHFTAPAFCIVAWRDTGSRLENSQPAWHARLMVIGSLQILVVQVGRLGEATVASFGLSSCVTKAVVTECNWKCLVPQTRNMNTWIEGFIRQNYPCSNGYPLANPIPSCNAATNHQASHFGAFLLLLGFFGTFSRQEVNISLF